MEILNDWSFWEKAPSTADVHRDVELPKSLSADLVLIIQGVRRGGKSTLLQQIPAHYQFSLANCYYCNFEDPRLINCLNHELLGDIVRIARKDRPTNEPCYFFFDEIQHVFAWEKWLHMQLERPKHNYFVVTGSSSVLLSGEFDSALTGRHRTLQLYPFSFREYLKLFPERMLESYLMSGGFPRTLTHGEPKLLLQEYFNDILLRDVLRRVGARSVDPIKQVAKLAFDTCGSQLSYRKIAAITHLTVETVQNHLLACEQAYLLFNCSFFAFSEKKRLSRHKKFYPIDPGLRTAVTSNTSRDYGKALEQLVFLKLKQQCDQVYYWESPLGGEVDFVTVSGDTITPYQVTWQEAKPRHEKALGSFYESFPQANEAIIIQQQNAADFLLGP
ncbi:MAG: ATP-binding protein [Myxococcaceae bacterium]|nr:ATP-binding protein [Myxococcaceae bacterium]